jgi:hypothetical protein
MLTVDSEISPSLEIRCRSYSHSLDDEGIVRELIGQRNLHYTNNIFQNEGESMRNRMLVDGEDEGYVGMS